jgi:hypothetical protein
MKRAFAALLIALLSIHPAVGRLQADEIPGVVPNRSASGQSGTSIIETGKTADGKAVYSVRAYNVDIAELLGGLFRQTGEECVIDQDVSGPITLAIKDATIDQILERVQASARPAIKITRGKFTRVSLLLDPRIADAMTNRTLQGNRVNSLNVPNASGLGYNQIVNQQSPLLNRPVTLNIPDSRPIPLSAALQMIQGQTQVPIRLDSRIPSNVGFVGQMTQVPLSLVLETITRIGAFKWIQQPDGSLLIAPSDRLTLFIAESALGNAPCNRCNQLVLSSWKFCPHCGQTAARAKSGIQTNPRRNPR